MTIEPYSILFPETNDPVLAVKIDQKMGKIAKGTYGFIELYCTEKGCDCRQATVIAMNKKMKQLAIITMPFDPVDDVTETFLDDLYQQTPSADELLEIFVQLVNDNPHFLDTMHQHYRDVRSKIEGKKYRGKAFPKPGKFILQVAGLHDDIFNMINVAIAAPMKQSLFKKENGQNPSESMRYYLERYYKKDPQKRFDSNQIIKGDLRRYILDHDGYDVEFTALLQELFSDPAFDEELAESGLVMLMDILEVLRVDLERRRTGSAKRMERFQNTLAQKIYVECGDDNLCGAVSHILFQSRVDLLPVLHNANSQKLILDAHHYGVRDLPPEEIMKGMFDSIEDMGVESPFEVLENLMQVFGLGDSDLQTDLASHLMLAESKLVRDTAALMLFHPSPAVRVGVSKLLFEESTKITSETLRRIIITRNWFPENIRKNIDKAISSARRSRVECASLPKNMNLTIYASPVDGAFVQAFHVIVPEGKGFKICSIMVKKGVGVADAFVISLATKKELNDFLTLQKREVVFIESSTEYLDQRICHALAEGVLLGNVPNPWLAHVAEILGKDQWKATAFDEERERALMRGELELNNPEYLTVKVRNKTLKNSIDWHKKYFFIDSWFEDDIEVDKQVEKSFKKFRLMNNDEIIAVEAIVNNILEKRRHNWLERLTLTALFLKSSPSPPLQWQQMFILAEAVADNSIPLIEIPLMESVASQSMMAYLGRKEEER